MWLDTFRRRLRTRIVHALRPIDPDIQWLSQHGLCVGRNVYIGVGCYLDPGFLPLISIGDDVTISPGVRILAHDASMYQATEAALIGRVRIGNGVYIGAGAILLPGVSLGDGTVVGAGTVVRDDVPSGSLVIGNPAQVVGSVEEFAHRHRERQAHRPIYPGHLFGTPTTMDGMAAAEVDRIRRDLTDGPGYLVATPSAGGSSGQAFR